ncbi:2-aminoethanethiol dioxygenase, partial [Globisporangium splendens]
MAFAPGEQRGEQLGGSRPRDGPQAARADPSGARARIPAAEGHARAVRGRDRADQGALRSAPARPLYVYLCIVFQLAVPIVGSAAHRKARHVRYQHIWEDDKFSMGIFILPPGASIPLHDHPEMTVISRVLYGNLHVKACDLVPQKEVAALVSEHFSSNSPSDSDAPSYRIARMCTNQEITAPHTTELLPDRGNLHEFVAGDGIGCAIFDILTPPYEPDEGRDCTYYRFVGSAKHDAASGDEFVALEEFDPVEFEVHSEPYKGPALALPAPMSTASSSSSVSSNGARSPSSSSP